MSTEQPPTEAVVSPAEHIVRLPCDTCGDKGEYEGDGGWYVCMDCDASHLVRVREQPARRLYTQAQMDKALADQRARYDADLREQTGLTLATVEYLAGAGKSNAELTGLGRSPAESTEEGTPAKVRLSDG